MYLHCSCRGKKESSCKHTKRKVQTERLFQRIRASSSRLLFQSVSDNYAVPFSSCVAQFFFQTLISAEVRCCFSFWREKPPRRIFNVPAQCFPDILNQGLLPRFTFFHGPPHTLTLAAESPRGTTDVGLDSGAVLTALLLPSLLWSMSCHGNRHSSLSHHPGLGRSG